MNEISYWGGGSVRDGLVRRLTATTFKELVERYVQVAVHHPLTRREFMALPERERSVKKDSAFISPCSYNYEQDGRRSDENAVSSVLAILDLDSGDYIKDFDEHPDTLHDHLYPFNFVAWRTASWTKENPRMKIMVELSPMHPSNHRRAIAFVASRIGAPADFKGSRESGVVSQPQYRPCLYKGDSLVPIVASRIDGIAIHLSDLPELEPEEQEMLGGRTYACDNTESDEFFGLAYLPIANLKPDDVKEALDTINPDCDYKQWISVVAALRHQFTEEEDAHEAYEMFAEWSSRGTSKFVSRRECWSKWRSYQPFARGRAPITLRTLYRLAQESGWDNTKAAKKVALTIEQWFEECQDASILMLEGAKMIAATPFKNEVVESLLLGAWHKRLKELAGANVEKSTLKKELARVRKEDKKAKVEAIGKKLPAWLVPYVYVASLDSFFNLGTGGVMKPSAFNHFYAKELMPEEPAPNSLPPAQPKDYALNTMEILRVEDISYDPRQDPEDKIFPCGETGKLLLNAYDFNSPPVADPEFKNKAEALIRELVSYLVKEKHLQETLLDFLARLHQAPGVKIPWAFMIQSAPGAGKGTLGEVLEMTLGHQNLKMISPAQMTSQFNDWATEAVLSVFNEVHIPGDRRDAVLNAIKPLISDPVISLNLKHRDGDCRALNVVNYLAFTNYKDAAHLAADDRRWCLCFSPIQTKEQSEKLQTSGRFEAIRWLTTPEGASALRYYFLKREIGKDFPLKGHAPNTKYRTEVVEQSKNQLQIAIEDVIEDGDSPLVGPEVIHEGRLRELVCRTARDPSLIPRYLSLMGYERESAKRVMVDGSRGALWVHTENWKGELPTVDFLKHRLKMMPELDDPLFE